MNTHSVALYARVSTDDKGQDPENQLRELRRWCAAADYTVAGEYVEYESGRKGVTARTELNRLFVDASRRQFTLVLFWSLDRFSREGMAQTVLYLERLNSYGVAFHSYTESFLSTENELVRDVLLSTLASLAKLEAQKISQRTKAGLERARAKGKQLGRPSLSATKRKEIASLRELEPLISMREISRRTGVPYSSVRRLW